MSQVLAHFPVFIRASENPSGPRLQEGSWAVGLSDVISMGIRYDQMYSSHSQQQPLSRLPFPWLPSQAPSGELWTDDLVTRQPGGKVPKFLHRNQGAAFCRGGYRDAAL